MCIAIAVPKGVELPSREELQRCFNANSHGAGFCYATGEDNRVHAHKGLMTFEIFYKALIDKVPTGAACLIHFRLGTSGKKTAAGTHHPECTHPFPVTNDYKSLFMLDYSFPGPCLVHNGVIQGYGRGDMSDTQEFVEHFASKVVTLDKAGDWNKIALLYPDCRIELHSKQWILDSGRHYSNTGYKAYTAPKYERRTYQDDLWGDSGDYDACGWSRRTLPQSATKRPTFAPAWDKRALDDFDLVLVGDSTYIVLADGTYKTAGQYCRMFESSYAHYRTAHIGVDLNNIVWFLKDYTWPIPCGRLTNERNKHDRKVVDRLNKEDAARKEAAETAEANKSVVVGAGAGAGLPHTTTTAPTTTTGAGKIDKDYVPPGGAAAWRGFKAGDRVLIDDPQCFAKNGKTGYIASLPDYKPSSVVMGGVQVAVNNRCQVTIDNGGGQYITTKPSDLRLLSSQVTPSTVAPVTPAPEVTTPDPVTPGAESGAGAVEPPPLDPSSTPEAVGELSKLALGMSHTPEGAAL